MAHIEDLIELNNKKTLLLKKIHNIAELYSYYNILEILNEEGY